MSDDSDNLFERLGGVSAIAQLVEEMYRRVLADPELSPFFVNVSMDRVRRMQFQFMLM